jgi:hypothetical protein
MFSEITEEGVRWAPASCRPRRWPNMAGSSSPQPLKNWFSGASSGPGWPSVGGAALAIGVTSVAFLLIYFPGWVQLAAMPVATTMASVFLIGLVCGLLRHRTGSCGQP